MQGSPMGKRKIKRSGRKRNRRYSPEFKFKAVQLAVRGDRTIRAVSDELGVPHQTLYVWVASYEREHGAPPPADGETDAERIERLEKRVAQLEEEREILKKAATFFAKESE